MINFAKWSLEVLFGIIIIIAVLSSLKFFFNSKYDTIYANVYEMNWKKTYITDFMLSSDECPTNYQKLELGIWSGYNEGCYCNNTVMFCYFTNNFIR